MSGADDVKQKLQKQIEFYFSDSNSHDRWLRGKLREDPDEYLPLTELLRFNRVKAICDDINLVRQVCEDSTELKLSEDKNKVKRARPWEEQDAREVRERSVLAKGIPADATLDDVMAFLKASGVGDVRSVRWRRDEAKQRKPQAWIELADSQQAEAFIAMKDLKWGDQSVTCELSANYWKRKGPKKGGAGKGKKDGNNNNNDNNKNDEDDAESKKKRAADREAHWPPGIVVRFAEIGTGLSRPALKTVFEEQLAVPDSVRFVDYTEGSDTGYVKLANAELASFLVERFRSGGVAIDGKVPVMNVLEGAEFDAYIDRAEMFHQLKANKKVKKNNNNNQRGRKGKKQGDKGKNKQRKDKNAHQTNE